MGEKDELRRALIDPEIVDHNPKFEKFSSNNTPKPNSKVTCLLIFILCTSVLMGNFVLLKFAGVIDGNWLIGTGRNLPVCHEDKPKVNKIILDIHHIATSNNNLEVVSKNNIDVNSFIEYVAYKESIKITHGKWKPFFLADSNVPMLPLTDASLRPAAQCDIPSETDRFDCYPGSAGGLDPQKCEARGCCWKQASPGAPFCYYPKDFPAYKADESKATKLGFKAQLTRSVPSPWPDDVDTLLLEVMEETQQRLHFKISDPNNDRYIVPISTPVVHQKASVTDYNVTVHRSPFSITITRRSTGAKIFDTQGVAPLIFADQFIQLASQLTTQNIYGLGEHQSSLLLDMRWTKLSFWARDQGPTSNTNLYGTHPFYLALDKDNNANGVLLLNSNAMQVDLQTRPALTYRTTGGILDFYIFTGPTPDDVLMQYMDVIGKPFLPPFWALGFHLCRYGYTQAELKAVIKRMRAAEFPYDTQWTDIDYMRADLDWTYDTQAYRDLPDIVSDLHKNDQHYIMIVDPGISNVQPAGTYPPWDEGVKEGIFVMKEDWSAPIIGKVWPGTTGYPDFTHPNAEAWWYKQAKSYYDKIPFDSLWIDMDEPSNFVTGSTTGCSSSKLNYPPWLPLILDGQLAAKTICPAANHYNNTHYNLHNLYGHTEAAATHKILHKLRNNRSIIITRSTYISTGQYAGHWTGDISSTWSDLYYTMPAVLSFQMFGIPFIGADVCGFSGATTPELCTRWMQLGSFYPFMRNHNNLGQPDQDPATFDKDTQQIMKEAMLIRYALLPYLYTLLFRSHANGTAVVRPLFFSYPDNLTYGLDTQFLWGDSLLISPVLIEGATTVTAYLPKEKWYDLYTSKAVDGKGDYVTLQAPLDTINVHVRGGSILPVFRPEVTTVAMRKTPFNLLVSLSSTGDASGELFWDNGEKLDVVEEKAYNLITFRASNFNTTITLVEWAGYQTTMNLQSVWVCGMKSKPKTVWVNSKKVPFVYNEEVKRLMIIDAQADLLKQTNVFTWF